jgi:asparagine synthetase B (glutamine-hydrolysing)
MGIKMVPSGEGADELFEVIYISTKRQTHVNSMKKMYVIRKTTHVDCLRANKSLAAWELKETCAILR